MEALFGKSLLNSAGAPVDTAAALAGKVVGIYFSAHWCPPCRGFTPRLAEQHKRLQAAGKPFEIVFVSSDRDEESFQEYFSEMPWHALPYDQRDTKAQLSKRFKVSGIPTLVILDEDGEVITKDGRDAISGEDAVEEFPWKPPALEELLAGPLERAGGESTSFEALRAEGSHIALYFSAHWCGPCRGFTPRLAETYSKVKAAGKKLEVVFVSSDRDQASCDEYFAEMPWSRLPFADRSLKEKLSTRFDVEGIPSLVILDPSLKVVNGNARGAVGSDSAGANFPWAPPPYCDVEEDCDGINDTLAVVCLCEGCDDPDAAQAEAAVAEAAKEAKGLEGHPDAETLFFVCKQQGRIAPQIRKLLGLGKPSEEARLALLDLADGAFYLGPSGDAVDAASVRGLLAGYRAKSLERQALKKGSEE